jgi:hypothetical protein
MRLRDHHKKFAWPHDEKSRGFFYFIGSTIFDSIPPDNFLGSYAKFVHTLCHHTEGLWVVDMQH